MPGNLNGYRNFKTVNTNSEMKKVLWFSRHDMTPEQLSALGNVEVTKVNVANMPNVHVALTGAINDGDEQDLLPFKDFAKDFDILAVVLPIGLEQQVLLIAGNKPVIRATNERKLVKSEDGTEDKVVFNFAGWKQLVKIEVVLEDFPAQS